MYLDDRQYFIFFACSRYMVCFRRGEAHELCQISIFNFSVSVFCLLVYGMVNAGVRILSKDVVYCRFVVRIYIYFLLLEALILVELRLRVRVLAELESLSPARTLQSGSSS